jgi:hypothetical protein
MPIEARNRPLPDWFTRIRTRQTVLPRFQRFEAWGFGNVVQLFNTILQDLPVGALLVLEIGDEEPFVSRAIIGAPTSGERVSEHLLDGQQRLTALWRGLHNNYTDRTLFLCLKPDEETKMNYYVDSVGRWSKESDTEVRPFWANRPKELWKRRMIPLELCAPDIAALQLFREWTKEAIDNQDERDTVSDAIALIRQKFAAFNLPFLSLPVTTEKQTALDVFIKMNTSAEPLSTYDVVVAQVEAGMGRSLHDLVADTRAACPSIADYYPPEELMLYASALLQGRAPTNATYLAKDFGPQVLSNWKTFLLGVSRTIAFLEQERVFDAQRLPSDVVLPVLVALWGMAPSGLDAEGRARTMLRKYLWRAFFSNRYEKSTNSRALTDFNELKAIMHGTSTTNPVIFDDEQYPLPSQEQIIAAGWPVRRDRLARAILGLALRKGGLDLADGSAATRQNLGKREYHHLFPVAHLAELGVAEDKVYLSLNCALVTWRTNRNISDKTPERYLGERRDGNDLGDAEVEARLSSHLIPLKEMIGDDYDGFLKERASLVVNAMTKLCKTGLS